jgi:hypothetical protein
MKMITHSTKYENMHHIPEINTHEMHMLIDTMSVVSPPGTAVTVTSRLLCSGVRFKYWHSVDVGVVSYIFRCCDMRGIY